MKKILPGILLGISTLLVTCGGQDNAPPATDSEKELIGLEQELGEALKSGDERKLKQMLGDDFTSVGMKSWDQPLAKGEYIDNSVHHYKIAAFSFNKTKVRIHDRTAIVNTLFTYKATFRDQDVSGTYVFLDVWVKRGARWQLVSRNLGES